MGKLRAWLRIIALVLVLIYFLSGLLMKTWLFGIKRERGLRYRRKFIKAALKILGVRLAIEGVQHTETALYASNHRSMLDPFINLLHIDAVIVSKAEVSKYPLIGIGAKVTGVIFVERDKGSSRAAARDAIRGALEAGLPVLIYPEGTTSNVETTQEFKIGSFVVAAANGTPVVPVMVEYRDPTHKWHEGGLLPFFVRKFSARSIIAESHIGPAMTSSDPGELLELSKSWIDDQLIATHDKWDRD